MCLLGFAPIFERVQSQGDPISPRSSQSLLCFRMWQHRLPHYLPLFQAWSAPMPWRAMLPPTSLIYFWQWCSIFFMALRLCANLCWLSIRAHSLLGAANILLFTAHLWCPELALATGLGCYLVMIPLNSLCRILYQLTIYSLRRLSYYFWYPVNIKNCQVCTAVSCDFCVTSIRSCCKIYSFQ